MFNSARQRVGIGLAAGLVIASVVGITSMTASGESGGAASGFYGTVTIELTDRAGTVTLQAGDDTYTQALKVATPCSTLVRDPILDADGNTIPGNLLNFSATVTGGTSPNVQLPADGLGVTDGANCGEPAGLFGPGETLTVALGSYFANDIKVGSASLSIGKTHPRDGSLRIAYGPDPLGSNIPIKVGGQVVEVTGTEFTSITLASTADQNSRGLSLKSPTAFTLVAPSEFENAVFCSDDPVEASSGGTAAESVTYTRGENGDAKNTEDEQFECDDIGVDVVIVDENVVCWDNGSIGLNTGDPQDVRALVEIVWEGVDPGDANGYQIEIQFECDPDGEFFEALWCESFTQTEGEGGKLILDAELPYGPIGRDADGELDFGLMPWCLVSNAGQLIGDKVVTTTVFYGAGDPGGQNSFK
jgi:hypothetical protein